MTPIAQKLRPTIELLTADKIDEAKSAFLALNLVDTKEHLAFPLELRHLIWNLYEFLVARNLNFTSKNEIISAYEKLFGGEYYSTFD